MPPLVRRITDCPTESWSAPAVEWWTLVSGDRTESNQLTAGIAEIPVGADAPERGHTHDAAEIYYFISGSGYMSVDGEIARVAAGDTVFIPEGAEHFAANDGSDPLRLFYVFARDAFSDVHYEFPGGK